MDPLATIAHDHLRRHAAERFGEKQPPAHRDRRRRGDGVVRRRRAPRGRVARRRLRGLAEALLH